MSLRLVHNLRAQGYSLRAFSCSSKWLKEHRLSIDTDEKSRPLIPKELVARSQSISKNRIPSNLEISKFQVYEYERLRIVPNLRTFYGGNPLHEENLNMLNALIRKYINLPTRVLEEKEMQSQRFVSFEEYKKSVLSSTRLKPIHHKDLTLLLHRLRSIDQELMPKEVSDTLAAFTRKSNVTHKVQQEVQELDSFGRAHSSAKRKDSVAKIFLSRGDGQVLVNGKSLVEYFPKDVDRVKIAYPFQVVSQEGGYNIFARVHGGGSTGQLEAIMYAVAKALVVFNPLLKSRLHKAGLMTSDARRVERKKPGKLKARKSPTWVKR
ncbi:uncharacterized protein PRCAT00000889001 [Priceomyces carsonii]|uniref:uncharacterized protein n=1 Tax=Priceomyces carsonii TaxID=28549 RepID=UPI002EDB817B|nr:unnamed protein product [Priceomyces carsonii]